MDESGQLIASGGRVLGVTALGGTILDAQRNAYKVCGNFSKMRSTCTVDCFPQGIQQCLLSSTQMLLEVLEIELNFSSIITCLTSAIAQKI